MFRGPSPSPIETDLVIIGAGVTGIAASQQLLESNADFWLLGSPFESQLAKAGELRETNLPEGTIGLNYIEELFEQLKEGGINYRSSLCTGVVVKPESFIVQTKFQDFICKTILVSTGCKQTRLGFEGEEEFYQQGISDCTVCDFPLYRGKPVAVIGNHEYTSRAAAFMEKHAGSVSLLWYETDGCPDIKGVDCYDHVSQVKATGGEVLEQISFTTADGSHTLDIQGLFVEGKPSPVTSFLVDLEIEMDNEFIVIDDAFQTNIAGLFAAGDVTGQTHNFNEATLHGKRVGKFLSNHFN